ncbi:IMC-associated protein 1 [Cyclospora cayetanensis]|uniref:IMC-associated protein 1 n=1 Tax=Cyclospora cayetanensis TaxID=88456 RepID=A0A1D3CXY6_9EIME|nr:IMC-associated protein 1 [Cyclospora cayetanensis]
MRAHFRVVSAGRSPPPAFKSRVSSEVYRLEENMRRCRDGSKVFRSRQGSSLSRSGGSPCGSFQRPAALGLSSPEIDKQASESYRGMQSFSSRKSTSGAYVSPQEPLARRSSSKQEKQPHQQKQHSHQPKPPAKEMSSPPVAAAAVQQQQQRQPQQRPPLSAPKQSIIHRSSTAVTRLSDMSPEEKEEEKRRLQALVKEFAREAVAGFGLTIVDADRDLSAAATFSMDRHLLDISIDSFEEAQVPSAHFAVGSLTGAFKAEDFYNGEKNPQAPLSVDLESALVLTTKQADCPKITLAFEGRRERDKAYTCLKILRLSVDLAKK